MRASQSGKSVEKGPTHPWVVVVEGVGVVVTVLVVVVVEGVLVVVAAVPVVAFFVMIVVVAVPAWRWMY